MPLRVSNCKTRGLSALLALSILLGSFSVVTGVCIVGGLDHPELALEMCHPLQSFNVVSTPLIAPPVSSFQHPVLYAQGAIPERTKSKIVNLNVAPDPPPPKAAI
ncbi:MAG: hypothetical protein JO121_16335 [Deltaproteobacteria bacterium]|jgi:hypothetical protein|nr:hypothetical protein [Deltaproteobacteria bacterium]